MASKEPSMAEPEREILQCMFEQNWLQFRHAENERLGFTAIYCAVVSGVLSFLASADDGGSLAVSVALMAFLLLFTLLGLAVSLRLGSAIRHHRDRVDATLREMGVGEERRKIGAARREPDWTTRFTMDRIFPAFYGLAFFTVLSVLIAVVL